MDSARAIDSLYATAHWLLQQDRTSDALDVFRAMLFAAPTDERSWIGAATCHERLGQPTVAMQLYALATTAVAGSSRIELARARLFRTCDHPDLAADAYARAAELAHDSNEPDLAAQIANEERAS